MNKNIVRWLTVQPEQEGQRLDNFLIKVLKGVPKSHIYRLMRKGEVRVNKKRIKPEYRLKVGDEVRIPPVRQGDTSELTQPSSNLQDLLRSRILYEDTGLLIINKPAGIAVHGGSGISLGVIEALRAMRTKPSRHPGETAPIIPYLELAHRLDRETSGCLLLAKKPSILKELHELLRRGQVEKTYQALVKGHWPSSLKEVDEPLKKFHLQSGERMVSVDSEGKSSQTTFRVIQRFANSTLIEAKPKTGRTHQIRVHAAHAGHPIVGDDKYGDKIVNKQFREWGCKRLFLHAYSLNFTLSSGTEIAVTAALDTDLTTCLSSQQELP